MWEFGKNLKHSQNGLLGSLRMKLQCRLPTLDNSLRLRKSRPTGQMK